MQKIKSIGYSVLALAAMSTALELPQAEAQSRAFPAFTPEAQTPVTTSARPKFPMAEPEVQTPPRNQFPQQFPVENIGFPQPKLISQATEAGPLTLTQLGSILQEMSLQPTQVQDRQDILYRADFENQEIELYFSLQLTEDQSTLRVRAWLDPLPEVVVSEKPLLDLLSKNSELKPGMYFGFSKQTNRFLMETSLPNHNLNTERVQLVLQEMSKEVVDSWTLWSTSEWKGGTKRVAEKPELDSRSHPIPEEMFEMPLRR